MKNHIISIFENDFLNYIITVLWVIGIMNSINMLDNMDGITTVTSLFIFFNCTIFLAFQNDYEHYDFMIILGITAGLLVFLFIIGHLLKYTWVILEVNL